MSLSIELKKAFTISIPILMGYIVLGFAFGLLITSFGYAWYIAVLMSVFIYAGALQFVAINFFSVKAGYVDIAIASWFVNIRQSFYGLSLLKKFKNSGKLKPYLIFSLTDEVYALLTTIKEDNSINKKYFYFYLGLLSQIYWIIGTIAGSFVGSFTKFDTAGLEFSLTALFVVLCIEQYKNLKNIYPFLIGLFASIFSLIFIPSDKMLIVSIFISLLMLLFFRKKVEIG
ncbi:AzlC family ABC transporter permease [Arcobacter sp. CECT 8985]|uniref:AzlC family ABC transporter permease n=1 Tax=Arcobacter sp. CECT 8985 TaxID=1935424 RepID=UPI00100B2916|nr:AzlC family ABC transporter permease [Arcobacter sp. CECT 8985]RXJ87753.1 branched-chain amino acid transporter AzlC [Arcobacter sp. CECT 8985]